MKIIITTVIKLTVREKEILSYTGSEVKLPVFQLQCNYDLGHQKLFKCFSIFYFIFFLLIHSCKTIQNIVLILQVILQETYTEKIREDAEKTHRLFISTTEIAAHDGHLDSLFVRLIESFILQSLQLGYCTVTSAIQLVISFYMRICVIRFVTFDHFTVTNIAIQVCDAVYLNYLKNLFQMYNNRLIRHLC